MAPDGTVTLTIGKSEMGQGVRTALAMILADELEADWPRIKLVQALPGPDFQQLDTGRDSSIASSWKMLRQAAAAAREMLITAAAARWKVDPTTCSAAKGEIVHAASKRSLKFGELVADAAKLPVPADPPLKKPSDFDLIGKPTRRIDGRDIVSGAARYGSDTKIPKMLYASIERAPWPGAKAEKFAGGKGAGGSRRARDSVRKRNRRGRRNNLGRLERPGGARGGMGESAPERVRFRRAFQTAG